MEYIECEVIELTSEQILDILYEIEEEVGEIVMERSYVFGNREIGDKLSYEHIQKVYDTVDKITLVADFVDSSTIVELMLNIEALFFDIELFQDKDFRNYYEKVKEELYIILIETKTKELS